MFTRKKYCAIILSVFCAMTCMGEIIVKNGETVAFLGDSITLFGCHSGGYVRLVENGLARNNVKITVIPAGESGNRSSNMVKRIGGVLNKKPDWIVVSCGVNDVIGVAHLDIPFEQFKKNLSEIVRLSLERGTKVILLTQSLRGENADNVNNKRLDEYRNFTRELAKEHNLPLADIDKAMRTAIAESTRKSRFKLTFDDLHMDGYGNQVMAACVLKTLGLTEQEVKALEPEWNRIPSMTPILNAWYNPQYKITIPEYELLEKRAREAGKRVDDYSFELIKKHINELKKQ